MSETFPRPDYNPWQTLSNVTGEGDTARLQDFVYGLDALFALIYRGQANKGVDFGDPATMEELSALFNRELPGVPIDIGTIMRFISVHGEPDEYSAGVIGQCTGITDRREPSEEDLARARSILDKL